MIIEVINRVSRVTQQRHHESAGHAPPGHAPTPRATREQQGTRTIARDGAMSGGGGLRPRGKDPLCYYVCISPGRHFWGLRQIRGMRCTRVGVSKYAGKHLEKIWAKCVERASCVSLVGAAKNHRICLGAFIWVGAICSRGSTC